MSWGSGHAVEGAAVERVSVAAARKAPLFYSHFSWNHRKYGNTPMVVFGACWRTSVYTDPEYIFYTYVSLFRWCLALRGACFSTVLSAKKYLVHFSRQCVVVALRRGTTTSFVLRSFFCFGAGSIESVRPSGLYWTGGTSLVESRLLS